MADGMGEAARRGGDMEPEELRRAGYACVDWAVDYLSKVGDLPVLPDVAPGQVRDALPAAPPEQGETIAAILDDLDRVVVPATTHWNHPRFHAYFAITGSGPGILGELLTAAMNSNGMLWRTAPAGTELEQVTLDWLRQLLGLGSGWQGIIMDSASMSTFVALAAARERRFPGVRTDGFTAFGGVRPRIYASDEAHSSVDKAAVALGLGTAAVRRVAVDAQFRMDPDALAEAVAADAAGGEWGPMAVVATVGTTSTTSVDPLAAVTTVCRRHGLWCHVDAAYGGAAAAVPELRWVLDGADGADSLVVNPHKWLFTPIDCSAFYLRDPATVKAAFALVPAYLRTSEEGAENYMDWGLQLGRRFRALKLWMVLRYFGREGIAAAIREHVRLAGLVAAWVDSHPGFERLAPTPLSTVCFRAVVDGAAEDDTDERNTALLAAVNATGEAYLSDTRLRGRVALRMAIGNLATTEADVRRVLAVLDREADRLR